MKWTDRIRHVKMILLLAALVIALASLFVSSYLTRDLEKEEQNKMQVWAEAMRSLSNADEHTDLNLVLKVINENNTIPVIVMDSHGVVQTFRNIKLSARDKKDSLQQIKSLGDELLREGKNIRISLNDSLHSDYMEVCYDDSLMLKRLAVYPFVQLGVVLLFAVVAVFALLASKRAEQNKLWVGLSKETAHQLGTPISSLMAWQEILKESYPNDELISELGNDISRLQLIADRFSKIGSFPEPIPTDLNLIFDHVIDYMNRRTSARVEILKENPFSRIIALVNAPLFEWVIENLCKNAVDAMGSEGGLIRISVVSIIPKLVIEVSDTGKGIPKKELSNIFRPGFTTKKRGWGLGLSLAKRIIEEYHKGKIYVKKSELGRGTTFRIELRGSISVA